MCVKAFDDDTISDTETVADVLPDRVHWHYYYIGIITYITASEK